MTSEDPLDFAQIAIARVASIATLLGVEYKRQICAFLGGQLLLVADFIDTASLDQEEWLRLRISKLLGDVEKLCSWPRNISKGFPLLEAIGRAHPDSPLYNIAQRDIRQGLANLTSNPTAAEKAIHHLLRFTERGDKKRRQTNDEDSSPSKRRATPAEYPGHINGLVHNALQKHMRCTCEKQTRGEHLVRLLLQPPLSSKDAINGNLVNFDFLFSSAPFHVGSGFSRWQDVQLLVPWERKKSKKRVQFVNNHHEESNGDSQKALPVSQSRQARVDPGQFCKLISLDANSRLCLIVQDGELQKSGFEPLKQIVDHVPGISLTEVLDNYRLTAKTKLALAYILAHSVWQFYGSDWMTTKWSSETIQFMKESEASGANGNSRLYPCRPYLSVRFAGEDQDLNSGEPSYTEGEIHRYPRIKAFGIMLVEISIGRPLRNNDRGLREPVSRAAKANSDLLFALECSRNDKLWGDCDYPDYRSAVHHCLDPGAFNLAAPSDEKERKEDLRYRRDSFYENVVLPLEELLLGTKWMDQLTTIAPLEIPSKVSSIPEFASPEDERKDSKAFKKNTLTKSQKEAKVWLSRMRRLNNELPQTVISPRSRVRIAVLDTGCDDNSPFFFNPDNASRLAKWKDWAAGSEQFEDCHGHGTHLVSLAMKIAPEAHICVARVAQSPDQLYYASENVAKAITWASREWKADIISMSFGYAEEQPSISRAIREAMYERDDRIIFFAAASNYGANEKEMFPARHESVISMRGTNAKGDFEDFNPPRNCNEETIVFGTLGLDVPSAWLSEIDNEVYKSGTSIATVVGAGIAGALLGYAITKSENGALGQMVSRKLRTRQGMLSLFRALASPTLKDHYLYLTPWKLMGKADDVRWAIFVAALCDI
ncbi:hypothetical protein PHISCL_03794 [Aspergillus sclerotialis]|uniref:Uncharacterized protein n=1 Tax=Aspergillus sclerotialis TaxID=2070753 RepID=A0A3A2ZL61_9EURO|nr:hypothetical protein PHISCL_03794 [Aspergillus sclerotialis]